MSTSTRPSAHRAVEQQWNRLLDALREAGAHVTSGSRVQDEVSQGRAVRYLQRVLRGMFLTALEVDDPGYPVLVRLFDAYLPYGNSNPDCTYFHATVSSEHTYRISGRRGTAQIVEVQIMDGHFLAGPAHKSLLTLPDVQADASGNLDIVLSATSQPGNWARLDPGARWLYVRQYFYDWENEVPADLVIERIGATYPPPVPSSGDIARRVDRLIGWIPGWYRHLERRIETYFDAPEDRCLFSLSSAGMDGLHYGKGHFDIRQGRAVVLEFRPPRCRYWSIQVMNNFWESQEYDIRQTSLNAHQGQLDPDGVFRAVISTGDPGVPNWLDPVGHELGLICVRVLYPGEPPEVTLRTVSADAIRGALHPATPVMSAAARSESLRRRMLGARRRFRE